MWTEHLTWHIITYYEIKRQGLVLWKPSPCTSLFGGAFRGRLLLLCTRLCLLSAFICCGSRLWSCDALEGQPHLAASVNLLKRILAQPAVSKAMIWQKRHTDEVPDTCFVTAYAGMVKLACD